MTYIQQKSVKSHIMLFDSGHFPVPVPKMFTGQYWKTQNAITGQATGRGRLPVLLWHFVSSNIDP